MKILKLFIIVLTILMTGCCALSVDKDAQMYVSNVEYISPNTYKYTVRATGSTVHEYLILYMDYPVYKVGDIVKFHTTEKEEKK